MLSIVTSAFEPFNKVRSSAVQNSSRSSVSATKSSPLRSGDRSGTGSGRMKKERGKCKDKQLRKPRGKKKRSKCRQISRIERIRAKREEKN